jgi:hypothetical protein
MKKSFRKRCVACRNKIKHSSFQNAIIACKKLKKEKNLIAYPYKCKRCNKYHIGKPTFRDNPMNFWQNIYNKMSAQDLEALKKGV